MHSYVILLALAGLGSCLEIDSIMPSRIEIESSINRTIEEVEKMIQENPTLPKLSRNEIVGILQNITSTDIGSVEGKALEAIQKTREDYQRALMVVLPYKPNDTEESLTDLYTKPPVVQIVQDDATETRKDSIIETAWSPSFHASNNVQQSENLIENKHQLVMAHMRFEDSEKSKKPDSEIVNYSSSLTTSASAASTTANPNSSGSKTDSTPQKFTFNLNINDQRADSSQTSIATKRPIHKGTFSRYRTGTRAPPKLEIIYSTNKATTTTTTTTTTTQTPTTARVETTTELKNSRRTTLPTTTTTKTEEMDDSPWKPMAPPHKDFFLPTVQSQYNEKEEPNFADVKEEDFTNIMATETTTKQSQIFVTPSLTTNQKRVNSNVKTIPSGFKLSTTSTVATSTMREEVEQLLKSIGLEPMNLTKHKVYQNSAEIQGDEKNNNPFDLSKVKKNNTFEASPSNVKNLSPDIQVLFQRFGLQIPGQESTPTTSTTVRPTIPSSVNSYTHFKPLPNSSVRDKDFRNFLAKFGLGIGESRNQKAMQTSKQVTKRPSLIDAVPGNMRKILENIGLIKKNTKVEKEVKKDTAQKTKVETDAAKFEQQTTPVNEHIFKPHEIDVDDVEQREKIKNLLDTVRMVQEGKADVQDVQKVAHDLLQSTKTLANGPDPLKLEEILNNYRNSLKNEVKRQEEQTSTTAASTTREIKETTLSSLSSNATPASTTESVKSIKADQASLSSTKEEKLSKPSFFDTFDVSEFINNTENASSSTTAASSNSEATTKSGSFFDNLNIDDYTTEDSSKNANVNLSDLENSFGGSTAKPDPIIPTRPKTGLYFLLDWNSFLEVGEEGGEKVNLRFAPKVGDRTRFIPVKIP